MSHRDIIPKYEERENRPNFRIVPDDYRQIVHIFWHKEIKEPRGFNKIFLREFSVVCEIDCEFYYLSRYVNEIKDLK